MLNIHYCFPQADITGSVSQVEMLHRSNLLAILGAGTNPEYAENAGKCHLVSDLLVEECSDQAVCAVWQYALLFVIFFSSHDLG